MSCTPTRVRISGRAGLAMISAGATYTHATRYSTRVVRFAQVDGNRARGGPRTRRDRSSSSPRPARLGRPSAAAKMIIHVSPLDHESARLNNGPCDVLVAR